jgi:KDO2-lipid IV(A) lauroyltransferase
MQAFFYYLALPFIYLLSVLPFWLFYRLSDLIYVIIYYAIGYRRKVVTQNLIRSFPEKSEEEIRIIRKKFYRYFCDLFLETFKTLTIGRMAMLKHCKMNEEAKKLFERLQNENKSCIIVMGHYGNWEWGGNTFSLSCPQPLYVIYHPLSNKQYNNLIIGMRIRFGTRLIAMKETFREMVANRKTVTATAFIADQTPAPENAYWTTFLNQDTPVFRGTEKIAQKLNFPIIYVSIQRKKRGYYEMFAEMLCENPQSTSEGVVSELHTRRLEKDIINQPELWLWSHRRWKHRREVV